MTQNQETLISKLENFIRKYYKNELMKGAIFLVFWLLLLFIGLATLEYFGHYNTTIRAILFYTFVIGSLVLVLVYVARPLAGLFKIGQTLTHEQAARIVGAHFYEIGDSLLNTLNLQQQARSESNELLIAAIQQKTQKLTPIPFHKAININANKRYLRYLSLPLVLYALAYLLLPGMISDVPQRIINYNQHFAQPMPFVFVVQNETLTANQYSDFELTVKVTGEKLPAEVNLSIGEHSYMMQKVDAETYTYLIRNLQKNQEFKLVAGQYESQPYELRVSAKPAFASMRVKLDYPKYINKKSEWIDNPGDIKVPYGTQATWQVEATQTDKLLFLFSGVSNEAKPTNGRNYQYSKRLLKSQSYALIIKNNSSGMTDSLGYFIQVTPDAYPQIEIQHKRDTFTGKQFYFAGTLSDDYGISKLVFQTRILSSDNKQRINQTRQQQLAVPQGEYSHRFTHQFDLNELGVEPGEQVEMLFEVWDNDGVVGPKSTRAQSILFKAPSMAELNKASDAANNALKTAMQQAIKEAQKLQQEMKELERKMAEKKELSWEEKKKLENILERQKKLAEKMDQIKQEQKRNAEKEEEFRKQSEELLQKQEQVEKLFNELMNDEMKKLIKDIERMLQQQNKDAIKNEMEKMQLSNKDVEKELDRMLEQFKQLEVEKKIEESISRLDQLKDKQEKLAEKTKHITEDKSLKKDEKQQKLDEIKQEQQQVKEEFDQLKKQLDEVEKENAKLEEPNKLEDTKEEEKQVEEEMKQSEEELNNNKPEKAQQKQKKAAEKMEQMSEKMKKGREEEKEKEDEINAEALREILENTIQLSKDQEALMAKMNTITGYNPQFVEAGKEQKNIAENAKIIEDSLLALSKRVPQISSFVNKEVSKLKENLDRSVKSYGLRSLGEIRVRQQYAMTHANNLGVMLSEVLQQMQMEMNASGSNGGKKPKPGKGQGKGKQQQKKSMGDLKKMQEELNKQLREGLNKQEQNKGDKPGGQQGMGSKEFARMAAQQQAIRQQMQQMLNQMGAKEKEGLGGNNKLQEMQKLMEQTEKELFNKKLSSEMIQRQQDIMTRMLESEKAEKKQEEDTKREAEQAKTKQRPSPPDFEEYFKQKQKETEWLQTIPAELQPYYKEKAKEYFNKLSKEKQP